MIKKMITVTGLAVLLPAVSFAYWGIGVKGGATPVNYNDLDNNMKYQASIGNVPDSDKTSKTNYFSGGELFFEGNSETRVGLSIGYKAIAQARRAVTIFSHGTFPKVSRGDSIRSFAEEVPAILYLKHKAKDSSVALWLGAGAEHMKATTCIWTGDGYTNTAGSEICYTQNKIIPHADAGIEWYMFKNISLGINAAYLADGKFDKLKAEDGARLYIVPHAVGAQIVPSGSKPAGAGNYAQDYSGLSGELTLRVYFGGPAK